MLNNSIWTVIYLVVSFAAGCLYWIERVEPLQHTEVKQLIESTE